MTTPRIFEHRWPFIEQYVEGKTVLDIGSAELIGTEKRSEENNAIYNRIKRVADSVLGVELSEEQSRILIARGYNIVQGDAETFELDQKFDVVVAGELIEHLSNPGLFLDNARRHLVPGGFLVLTTPNRFSARDFMSAFRRNIIPGYSKPIAKHVMYFDENCLTDLLNRHGFARHVIAYYQWVGRPQPTWKNRLIDGLVRRFRSQFSAGLMIATQPAVDATSNSSSNSD